MPIGQPLLQVFVSKSAEPTRIGIENGWGDPPPSPTEYYSEGGQGQVAKAVLPK